MVFILIFFMGVLGKKKKRRIFPIGRRGVKIVGTEMGSRAKRSPVNGLQCAKP